MSDITATLADIADWMATQRWCACTDEDVAAVRKAQEEIERFRVINAELLKEGEDLAEKLDIERGENTRLRRDAVTYVEAIKRLRAINAELVEALENLANGTALWRTDAGLQRWAQEIIAKAKGEKP